MLDRERMIKEVYDMAHKHDSDARAGHRYEKDLLTRVVSPVLLRNGTLSWFVGQLQRMLVVMVDQTQELRNLFNHTVDRYYDGHAE